MIRAVLGDTARAFGRQWARFIAAQLLVNVALAVVVALVWLGTHGLAAAWPDVFFAGGGALVTAIGALGLLLLVLAAAPVFSAAASVIVRATDDQLGGRHPRSWRAAREGLGRTLVIVGSLLAAVGAAVAWFTIYPIAAVFGLLGLLATGLLALVRRRRPDALSWWPSWRWFAAFAIPLLFVARWTARAVVVVPVAVLEGLGIRATIVRAGEIARRSPARVLLIGLGALLWVNVMFVCGSLVGGVIAGETGSLVGQVVLPLLLNALPLAAMTALYRRDPSSVTGGAPTRAAAPRRRRELTVGLEPAVVRLVAAGLPAVLLVTGLAAFPSAASAAGASTGFSVTSSADSTDAGTLAAQVASCTVGGPDCTLRAALAAAEQVAIAGTAGTIGIGFAADMEISVTPGAPLDFTYVGAPVGGGGGSEGGSEGGRGEGQGLVETPPESFGDVSSAEAPEGSEETPSEETAPEEEGSEESGEESAAEPSTDDLVETPPGETPPAETPPGETPPTSPAMTSGVLAIDGTGHRVSIVGDGATQLFAFFSRSWDLAVSHLEFRDGAANNSVGYGGAISIGDRRTAIIDGVSFVNNQAYGGGALYTGGSDVLVQNSTFSGNGLHTDNGEWAWGGADILTFGGDVTVLNSTFVGSRSGSLYNTGNLGSTLAVYNSLFSISASDASGRFTCTGWGGGAGVTGADNVLGNNDTSCAGGTSVPGALVSFLDYAGDTRVYRLAAGTADAVNPALGAAGSVAACPAVDVRGLPRPAAGCDVGAYQVGRETAVSLSSSANPSSAGASVAVTATVDAIHEPGDVVGTVQFIVDGAEYGSPVAVGAGSAAIITIEGLALGEHGVVARYTPPPGAALSASEASFQQTVAPSGSQVVLEASEPRIALGDDVELDVTVTTGGVVPTGTVTITDITDGVPGVVVADGVALDAGVATVVTAALAAGARQLVATYSGDASTTAGASAAITVRVLRPSTTVLTVSPDEATYGTPLEFRATVTGTGPVATGSVNFVYGTRSQIVGLVDGVATLVIDTLASTEQVVAHYSGSDDYLASDSGESEVTVTPAQTATALTTDASSLAYGVPTTLTATVSMPTGSTADPVGDVVFRIDGALVARVPVTGSGAASATATSTPAVPELPVGEVEIEAEFVPGIADLLGSSDELALVVSAVDSTTALAATPEAGVSGEEIILEATVSPVAGAATPDGTVEFRIGATVLASTGLVGGVASVGVSTLAVGSHTIVAHYLGSDEVLASQSTPLTVTVGATSTTTTASVSPSSIAYGQSTLLEVEVSGEHGTGPTGEATVLDGATVIGTVDLVDGAGQWSIPGLSGGDHVLTVRFDGDDEFGASETQALVTVSAASTTTAFTIEPGTALIGEDVELTATVTTTTGAVPTGTVVFTFLGTEVGRADLVGSGSGATATLVTDALPVSTHLPRTELPLVATFVPGSTADFQSSTDDGVVIIKPGTTRLTLVTTEATYGADITVTATISVTSGAGTPTGSVLFIWAGQSRSVAVVDGAAALTGVRLPAGTTHFTAIYTSGDDNFLAGVPDGSDRDGVVLTVDASTPAISLASSATGSTPFGATEALTATILVAGSAPTGSVTFTANGTTVLGTALLPTPSGIPDDGPTTRVVELMTTGVPLGDSTITATYSGDGSYSTATSAGLARTTVQAATTTAVTATGLPTVAHSPITITATVARVGAGGAVPAGSVVFTVAGVALAPVTVSAGGTASIQHTPTAAGDLAIEAAYTPSAAGFAPSSGSTIRTVTGTPVDVAITLQSSIVSPGDDVLIGLSAQTNVLYRHLTLAVPSGSITVSDGEGGSCVARLDTQRVADRLAWGECTLTWPTAGNRTLTAVYTPDTVFATNVAQRVISVAKSTPQLGLYYETFTEWIAGDGIRLSWDVRGPAADGGSVTITNQGRVVCESTARSGSCVYPLPLSAVGNHTFRLNYGGDARWNAASTEVTRSVVACVPFSAPLAIPSRAGTVTARTEPNCGGGAGYIAGTLVDYTATANPGFTFDRWAFSSQVQARAGQVVSNTAYFSTDCMTVMVYTAGLGSVSSPTAPNCGGSRWLDIGGGGIQGGFSVDSVVELTATPSSSTASQSFYQWTNLPDAGADPLERTTRVTIAAGTNLRIGATFGVTCYHDIAATQPETGAVTLGATNCTDPRGPGYAGGSRVTVSAEPTGDAFFQQWTGNYWVPTDAVATERGSTASLYIHRDNMRVSADFGSCVQVNVAAEGWSRTGTPLGSATISPAGNCPGKGDGWYAVGSNVMLTAKTAYSSTFGGWSGLPVNGTGAHTTASATITRAGTFVAPFYWSWDCSKLTFVSQPAGAFDISVRFPYGTGSCPTGMFDKTIGDGSSYLNPAIVTVTPLTDLARNTMTGTTVTTGTLVAGQSQTLAPRSGAVTERHIYGDTTITAWACTGIDASLTLISPNGTEHPRSDLTKEDFISAAPAPNCPFGNIAYLPGTEVFVQANAPAEGYSFQGFSGILNTTDPYPETTISIDGTAKSVPLTATYQVVCSTLTTNWDNVQVEPKPNCPDTPASANSYIGGTLVALQATGDGDLLFRGWHGDTPDAQDGVFAFSVMTKNTAIYANYTSASVGERITSAFTSVGDALTVFSKKVAGVASAIVAGLVTGANPVIGALGMVALLGKGIDALFSALGVEGAVLDGITGAMEDIGEFVNFYMSPLSCATQWALAGDGGNAQTPDYAAAQHTAVSTLANRALQEQAIRDSAYIAAQSGQEAIAAGAVTWAKRLGTAATVGFAIYNAATSSSGIGWDSSGMNAWSSNGDLYWDCFANSSPDYMFPRPVSSGG